MDKFIKRHPTISAVLLGLLLSIQGCSLTRSSEPELTNYLQNNEQIKAAGQVRLTDMGIFRYGEDTIVEWGGQSQFASLLSTGGAIALATLSTAALAMSSNADVSRSTLTGIVAGTTWFLQVLQIIKPVERTDYRLRGEQDIITCRGEFLKSLSAKGVEVISIRRFTPQGAIYSDCIGAAKVLVRKGINGMRPGPEDFEKLKPIPLSAQANPGPEPAPPIEATKP